jgi:hypothetical protein
MPTLLLLLLGWCKHDVSIVKSVALLIFHLSCWKSCMWALASAYNKRWPQDSPFFKKGKL